MAFLAFLCTLLFATTGLAQAPSGPAPAAESPAPAPAGSAPVADAPPAADAPPMADAQYRLGASDVLQVVVYGEPSLTGNFTIDPTGELDFPLIGRVPVAGLTPNEAAAALRGRLTPGYLVNPNLTASVSSFRSQPVQVLGAVAKPGLYYLRGPTTVMQILSEAGGVEQTGVNEVRITKQDGTSAATLSYEQLRTGQIAPPALAGGDVVFVPQGLVSVIGSVGKPGEVAFREGLTVSSCIAQVGGPLPVAALGRIYVLRGEKRIRVNLRRILSGKQADVPLQAGDKVYVPESAV